MFITREQLIREQILKICDTFVLPSGRYITNVVFTLENAYKCVDTNKYLIINDQTFELCIERSITTQYMSVHSIPCDSLPCHAVSDKK